MAKRRKAIRAGRLVKVSLYSCPYPKDGEQERAAKSKCSSLARQAMNMKKSHEKLEMSLAANFDFDDTHIVLTYNDKYLPSCRDDGVALVKKFIVQLRKALKLQAKELKYIYVTEGVHGDKRLHHHMVLNVGISDLELLLSLWTYGDVHMERIDDRGYEGLARYLTKEPREHGGSNGLRSWTPSKNLKKPEIECSWVPDDMTLTAPPGAIIIESPLPYRNEFGEFVMMKYLLPKPILKKRKGRPKRKTKPKIE